MSDESNFIDQIRSLVFNLVAYLDENFIYSIKFCNEYKEFHKTMTKIKRFNISELEPTAEFEILKEIRRRHANGVL